MTHQDKEDIGEVFDLKLAPLVERLTDHHKTLYGNGQEGIKTKAERHDLVIKVLVWVVTTIGTAGVGVSVAAIAGAFK